MPVHMDVSMKSTGNGGDLFISREHSDLTSPLKHLRMWVLGSMSKKHAADQSNSLSTSTHQSWGTFLGIVSFISVLIAC